MHRNQCSFNDNLFMPQNPSFHYSYSIIPIEAKPLSALPCNMVGLKLLLEYVAQIMPRQ